MVSVAFTSNGQDVIASLSAKPAQLAARLAKAITKTAFDVRDDGRAEMQRVFDRPTPFTLNALRVVQNATPDSLRAVVGFRDFAPKGTAAGKYLSAQIEGGTRSQKRSERAIQINRPGVGVLFLVPTRFADYDQYGNWQRGQIVKILSVLQAFGQQGYRANRTERGRLRDRRRGFDYFAIYPFSNSVGGLKPGIYKRTYGGYGNDVLPIAIFTRSPPNYAVRFRFWEVSRASAARNLSRQIAAASTP